MMFWGALCFFAYVIMGFIILIPILFPVPVERGPEGDVSLSARDKKKVAAAALWVSGPAITTGAEKATKDDKAVPSMFTMFTWDLMDVTSYPWWQVAGLVGSCFLGMIYCGVATFGAVRMQTLESRVWGMAASIMMMLPVLGVGLFGILSMIFTFAIGGMFDEDSVFMFSPVWGLVSFGVNIGIGAWGLTTLLKEEVKAGYEYKSDA